MGKHAVLVPIPGLEYKRLLVRENGPQAEQEGGSAMGPVGGSGQVFQAVFNHFQAAAAVHKEVAALPGSGLRPASAAGQSGAALPARAPFLTGAPGSRSVSRYPPLRPP